MFFDGCLSLDLDAHAPSQKRQDTSLGQALASEDCAGHKRLQKQQAGGQDQEGHELVIEIHKADSGDSSGGQFVFELQQGG